MLMVELVASISFSITYVSPGISPREEGTKDIDGWGTERGEAVQSDCVLRRLHRRAGHGQDQDGAVRGRGPKDGGELPAVLHGRVPQGRRTHRLQGSRLPPGDQRLYDTR